MNVSDIMIRNVRTVSADTRMLEVSSIMCLYRLSGLPVVDAEQRLIGFIAEKDVIGYLFPTLEDLMDGGGMASIDLDAMMGKYKDLVSLKVSDLMSSRTITVPPDMHILKATSVMAKHRFRRIPVAEDGRLIGMLSLGDVHKALFHSNLSKLL